MFNLFVVFPFNPILLYNLFPPLLGAKQNRREIDIDTNTVNTLQEILEYRLVL